MLRAGTPSPSVLAQAAPEEPIAWLFEHKTLPIDERAIFLYEATPAGLRIKGFSIGAVNMSEEPISAVEGVLKPDLHNEDLMLNVAVDKSDSAGEAQPAAAPISEDGEAIASAEPEETEQIVTTPLPAIIVPPQASFRLIFEFPASETPEEVLKASGGLLLKVRYEIGGKQKSFIQYLPQVLLEDQLGELQAASKGS
jgi:hypothetical protein